MKNRKSLLIIVLAICATVLAIAAGLGAFLISMKKGLSKISLESLLDDFNAENFNISLNDYENDCCEE